ncbi:pyridoxamine 5'-phosphate oxidase family protein [Halopelagius longus]|uniref:PPOX class probable F420-dependent enzyme n=1 Tax=Halopelagius longus TaxID=1236180 RepID=A0A1H0Y541_9EURY|nr:pyridoxamine 5'-phosphate oxidase family protein [Halopelagius longus]RDI72280.1 pyridoxamine 5'-phosphate oxidase family protein [Halopelagius longus]SDQ10245.1 PPOX class probable F420-dependent enzyme [Halopelagius longus]
MSRGVDAKAEELLTSEPLMAHLATCRDGRPHVAPLWYRYEDGVVELVTTGTKLRNVRENPKVALSVQKDEGGHAQWMVTLLGTATVVEDEAETRAATRRINEKYGVEDDAWEENVLVRIDVGSASWQTYE